MNRIAHFEKVSYEIFRADLLKSAATYKESEIRGIYEKITLPVRATAHSAGYDFVSPVTVNIGAVSETAAPANAAPAACIIPTGIRARIDGGYFLGLFPRSGLGFKFGLRLSNTVGIIDSDYYNSDNEGHILVSIKSEKPLKIEAGTRFCQGIFIPYGITIDDSADAKRNGGMGSTD
jgi:dUTP pyrophosphatase